MVEITAPDNKISSEVIINGKRFQIDGTVDIDITPIDDVPVPDPDPNPSVPKPSEGTIKEGGWGGNVDPKTWKITNMNNPKDQFKIVDDKGINVATNFTTMQQAQNFINYFLINKFPPEVDTKPEEPPAGGTGTEGGTGDSPYPAKAGSKVLQSTQRGPTTRNYASGKPSDETVEKNVKDIPYRNYQWLVEVTIKEMEHDDTISLKFGGQHMTGNGWYDCGVGIQNGGLTCLGTEPKHPSTNLCIVKGPKIGVIQNKRTKIAGVFFEKNNHIELWTNVGLGWIKQLEGDNIGNLKPDHKKNHETQLRIDGFKKGSVPELHSAVVQEIDPKP